jgi:hypothetical protein
LWCDAPQEMRAHTQRLAHFRKHEDPRLSFTTPEFKEASRQFQEAFKVWAALACGRFTGHEESRLYPAPCAQKNFGKPVEWGLVKQYPVRVAEPHMQSRRPQARGVAFACRCVRLTPALLPM